MQTLDRQDLARIFRAKSDESFAAAKLNFEHKLYLSTCNRSWYAIYHAIIAGTYARLNRTPPKDLESFKHNAAESLLTEFLTASNVRLTHGFLIECLERVRRRRAAADYGYSDGPITQDDAQVALLTAQKVRSIVWEILQWPIQ